MRTTRTVLVLSDVEREQSLLKSLLNTFGHRPEVSWQYIEEGIADIVVLSVDKPSPTLLLQAEKLAKVVIFYAGAADLPLVANKAFVLRKPTRARDLLDMIEQVEGHFAECADAHQPIGRRTQGQPAAVAHSTGMSLAY
jgi:hypothetical protein